MGIPGFYGAWLRSINSSNYNYKILLKKLPIRISSLSLDFNAMLHNVAQKVYAYGNYKNEARLKTIETMTDEELMNDFLYSLETEFVNVVTQVNPTDTLVIAYDGPAPYSKIAQQRRRRYKALLSKSSDRFDPTNISTGTDFMDKVDDFMRDILNKYMNMLPKKIILSSQYVEGEGEHKIAKFMLDGQVKGSGYHVVYAKDADLSMLMMYVPLKRILISRESLFDIINVDNLKQYLFDNMKTKTSILDFIFLITLIGNDFMPGVVSSRGIFVKFINKMIEVYRTKRLSIIEYNKINYNNLSEFLKEFSKYEEEFLNAVSSVKFEFPLTVLNKNINNNELNMKKFRTDWYNKFLIPKNTKHFNIDIEFKVKKADVQNLVNEYILAMTWTYLYYTHSSSFNNRWLYVQLYAPLLSDIKNFNIDYVEKNSSILTENLKTMSATQQLLCIIPYQSKDILKEEYRQLVSEDSPIIYNYPVEFKIDKEGFLSNLEYIALLPPPYFEEVIRAIDELEIEQEYDEDVIIEKNYKK